MNHTVTVYTAQMAYSDPDAVDITAKTKHFLAPKWDMVAGHKAGKGDERYAGQYPALSDEDYTNQYYDLLRQQWERDHVQFLNLLDHDRVVLKCFCPAGDFCHRHLAVDILEKIAERYPKLTFIRGGELTAEKQQTDAEWCASQAADWLDDSHVLILDTETTGLDKQFDEPVQIGVIDRFGNVLMNTYLKPTCEISEGARNVHQISDETVMFSPQLKDIIHELNMLLRGRRVVVYNADYDIPLLNNTARRQGVQIDWGETHCAMKLYARYWGEWNSRYEDYRFQGLVNACQQQGIEVSNAHDAVGDCQMTLKILQKLASIPQTLSTD